MVTRSVQITPKATQVASFMQKNEQSLYLVNTDLANAFFAGEDPSNLPIPVQPLGQIEIVPGQNLYAATLQNGVTVTALISSGEWTPSAAQVAIATANLAKDTTVQSVATNTTGVAKDTTVSTVATNTTGAAKDASLTPLAKESGGNLATATSQLQSGVAPAVPNYKVASAVGIGPTVGTNIITPGTAFRVWAISLVSAIFSNAALAAGVFSYAGIFDTTNLFYLTLIQNALATVSHESIITQTFALNGMAFGASDSLQIDVNAGGAITNVSQRASYVVYYSTP